VQVIIFNKKTALFTSAGIVLKSFDYQEKARILTLFSKEEGVLSLIVKKISTQSPHLLSLSTPFCEGEYSYLKKRSDLYLFQEGIVLTPHLTLRNRLSSLRAASHLAQLVLSSQMPGQSSPFLYLLFSSYLKQLPLFEDPFSLVSSFEIKLLIHEGLMPSHRDPFFSQEEWSLLVDLAEVRSFTALKKLKVEETMQKKVREYTKTKM